MCIKLDICSGGGTGTSWFLGVNPRRFCPNAAWIKCLAACSVSCTSFSVPILGFTSAKSMQFSRPVRWTSSIIWIPSRRVKPPRTVDIKRFIYGKKNSSKKAQIELKGSFGSVMEHNISYKLYKFLFLQHILAFKYCCSRSTSFLIYFQLLKSFILLRLVA